jgi:hypothetical protein
VDLAPRARGRRAGRAPGRDDLAHLGQLSKALKKRGFSFVGPTTVHAFLQAMGLINDHAEGCVARGPADAARRASAPGLSAGVNSAKTPAAPRPDRRRA